MRRKYKIGPFIQGKVYLEDIAEFIFAFNQFDDFQISDSNAKLTNRANKRKMSLAVY